MIYFIYILLSLSLLSNQICPAADIERFPPPDFGSSYSLPGTTTPAPRADLLGYLDVAVLILTLSLASYLALKRRSRPGLFLLMCGSLLYFGFYRKGCICSIGSIQNVALAIFDSTYTLPLTAAAFFILPLVFSLFFGRIFCAGVCPLGALQDLLLIEPIKIPPWLQQALELLAYLYLATAVYFAALGSAFIICQYDPFVTFFRLSGNTSIVILGLSMLAIGFFVGRPYCLFLCPYGVILKFFSRFSHRRVTVAPDACLHCRLCEDACPFGAITFPTSETVPAPSNRDRLRLAGLLLLTPVIIAFCGWIFSLAGESFSHMHFSVRLAERIANENAGQIIGTTDASTAFRSTGKPETELYNEARFLQKKFTFGGWILGGFIGLVIACKLIGLSTFRRRTDYDASPADCLACGRCFSYCPPELERRKELVFVSLPYNNLTLQETMRQVTEIKNTKDTQWYPTVRNTAIVSGVFSLIVAGFLTINYIADRPATIEKNPLFSPPLEEQKLLLNQNPRDEELKKEIRGLDLTVRQGYFQRKTFSDRGKFLLLIGVLIFLLSLKKLSDIRRKLPMPDAGGIEPGLEAGTRAQSRLAVGIVGAVLIFGVLALAMMPGVDLASLTSEPAEPSVDAPIAKTGYASLEEFKKNWPIFRGPGGLGIVNHQGIPESWDGKSGKGILWKTELLLPGMNSPIIWGDRVFISGAGEVTKEVYCYSLDSGNLLWRKQITNVPGKTEGELNVFEDTGYAAPTMACDGERVFAIFVDGDLVCFDFDGNRVWAKNIGIPDSIYSYATSLTVYRNLLYVQYDQGAEDDDLSVLYAFEGKTGSIAWQAKRQVANSWTTPIVIETTDGDQLITCSQPWVIAYEPVTGEELWKANLMGQDLAPSPIYANDLVFLIKPNKTLYALRADGRGDVTETHVAWSVDCAAPDICSPVSNGEFIFLLNSAGELVCYETKNGEMVWEHQIDDFFQASPSLVGDWIYLLSEAGVMYRVKAAREIEEGVTASLEEEWVRASPAFADGRIIIRGDKYLYGIGNK